jgi:hypothetical protein
MKATTKMVAKVLITALSAGLFLRFVTDDDSESYITKTVTRYTVMFAIAGVGGLALLASPVGIFVLAGAAALAVLALGAGNGAFDGPARDGYDSARSSASRAVERADELRGQAAQAASDAAEAVEVEQRDTTVPASQQAPGVSEPVEADD